MQYPTEQVILAATAAIEALRESDGPLALKAIHRIAARMDSALIDSELVELRLLAEQLLVTNSFQEAQQIAAEIAQVHEKRMQTRAETLGAKPTTILLIEDDRLTARVLADMLAGPARNVLVATDAMQAQRLLREF